MSGSEVTVNLGALLGLVAEKPGSMLPTTVQTTSCAEHESGGGEEDLVRVS